MNTVNARDPTKSIRKRERFRQAFGTRWQNVRGQNRQWIMNRDVLASERIQSDYRRFFEGLATEQIRGTVTNRQVRRGQHWTGSHITTAYDAGLRQARADMRRLGAADEIVRGATRRSDGDHQKRLAQEYESVYYTVSDHVSYAVSQATNSLRDVIEESAGKRAFADRVNSMIRSTVRNRYRATANTAVTRAVNSALMASFVLAGVTEVGVAVEGSEAAEPLRENAHSVRTNAAGEVAFQTAGDTRVCAECRGLAGERFTISELQDDASLIPPRHVGCRCRVTPTKMKIGDTTIEAPEGVTAP